MQEWKSNPAGQGPRLLLCSSGLWVGDVQPQLADWPHVCRDPARRSEHSYPLYEFMYISIATYVGLILVYGDR